MIINELDFESFCQILTTDFLGQLPLAIEAVYEFWIAEFDVWSAAALIANGVRW